MHRPALLAGICHAGLHVAIVGQHTHVQSTGLSQLRLERGPTLTQPAKREQRLQRLPSQALDERLVEEIAAQQRVIDVDNQRPGWRRAR